MSDTVSGTEEAGGEGAGPGPDVASHRAACDIPT